MPPTATYFHGTGRRKAAVARVRLFSGDGAVLINGKPVDQYFTRELYRHVIEHAFRVSETMGKFSTTVRVEGGGVTGQAEAIRHGIARALVLWDVKLKPQLRKEGFLTRDPRAVERKKSGQPKARKRFQYSKR